MSVLGSFALKPIVCSSTWSIGVGPSNWLNVKVFALKSITGVSVYPIDL